MLVIGCLSWAGRHFTLLSGLDASQSLLHHHLPYRLRPERHRPPPCPICLDLQLLVLAHQPAVRDRPTKRSDSRSRTFQGESVELDAIPPDQLRSMVDEAITSHIDDDALRITRVAEQSEKHMLSKWSEVLSDDIEAGT